MVDRDASAGVLAELAASQNRPVHLVEVYFDSGTLYLTDAYRSVLWNGQTYIAQGHFLEFEGLDETLGLEVGQLTASLTGADAARTWPALALSEDWVDRRLVIYKAFLRDGGDVITDPLTIFDGVMDGVGIDDDPTTGECKVTVRASNHFDDFGRRRGRHTNDAEQQQHFSGDTFFEFTSQQNRTIYWGGRRHSEAVLRRFHSPRSRADGGDD